MMKIKKEWKKQKLVPKLRFPGFEGEWKIDKLGNLATFVKGKGISKKDIVPAGSSVYLISSSTSGRMVASA